MRFRLQADVRIGYGKRVRAHKCLPEGGQLVVDDARRFGQKCRIGALLNEDLAPFRQIDGRVEGGNLHKRHSMS